MTVAKKIISTLLVAAVAVGTGAGAASPSGGISPAGTHPH